MVDFLNDDVLFKGRVVTDDELLAEGGITVGAGGESYGRPPSELVNTWGVATRVRVANKTERDAVVTWRQANDPITTARPLFIWRADGSYLTGLHEMTLDGITWSNESPLAGDIEICLSGAAPTGWLLMTGQILSNAVTQYPALWETAHPSLRVGSDLRIPDMRGRVPMGAGTGTALTVRNLGDLVGSESVVLSEAQMPYHTHSGTTFDTDRSLNHTHRTPFQHIQGGNPSGTAYNFKVNGGSNPETSTFVYQNYSPSSGPDLNHLHPFITNGTGGNSPHPNVQPSTVLNFKVKL